MEKDKSTAAEHEGEYRDQPVGLTRRGTFAVIIGTLAAALMSGIRPKAAEAHANQITKGANNDAGATETLLRSGVSGDKATLAIFNEVGGSPGNPPPDGLRVFTSGSGGGAAIQAFGGPGTFSRAPHGGIGVRAIGANTGVIGAVTGTGIPALSGIGVFGTGPLGVMGSSANGTGVRGRGARGVHGLTSNKVDDVGVLAEVEEAGTAFEAKGPVKFSSAGLAIIAAGASTVTVPAPGAAITPNTKILCTLQSPGGVLLNVIRNANNTFTINLTANATAPVTVAWFVIS